MAKQLNFKALKKRIMMTSELILKYQENDHKLKESLSEVAALHHCIEGLKREVQTLHQENESLKTGYNKCLADNDELRDSLELEKMLTQQLTAQVEGFQEDRIKYDTKNVKKMTADLKKLKSENSKLKTRYVKLLKSTEAENGQANRKPPPSTLSPPYTPLEPPPKPLTPTPTPSPPDRPLPPLVSPADEITPPRPSTFVLQEGVSLTLPISPTPLTPTPSPPDHPLPPLVSPADEIARPSTSVLQEGVSLTLPFSPKPLAPTPTLSPPDHPLPPLVSPADEITSSQSPTSVLQEGVSLMRPINARQDSFSVLSPLPQSPVPPASRLSPPINTQHDSFPVLSPLPRSPVALVSPLHSPHRDSVPVLSPLPRSPVAPVSPLSPLHSPHQDSFPVLSPLPQSPVVPLSPLHSPINAHRDSFPVLSPLAQSPVAPISPLSPLPQSPVAPLSPLHSPVNTQQDSFPVLSPLPQSPVALVSPLSPLHSPINTHRDSFPVLSPLARSPISQQQDGLVEKLQRMLATFSDIDDVLSPLPASPVCSRSEASGGVAFDESSFVLSPLPVSLVGRCGPAGRCGDLSPLQPSVSAGTSGREHACSSRSGVCDTNVRPSPPLLSPPSPGGLEIVSAPSASGGEDLVELGECPATKRPYSPPPVSPVGKRSPAGRRGDLSPLQPSESAGSCSRSGVCDTNVLSPLLSPPSPGGLEIVSAPSASGGEDLVVLGERECPAAKRPYSPLPMSLMGRCGPAGRRGDLSPLQPSESAGTSGREHACCSRSGMCDTNVLSPLCPSPPHLLSPPSPGGLEIVSAPSASGDEDLVELGERECPAARRPYSPLPVSPVGRRGDLSPLQPSESAGTSGREHACCSRSDTNVLSPLLTPPSPGGLDIVSAPSASGGEDQLGERECPAAKRRCLRNRSVSSSSSSSKSFPLLPEATPFSPPSTPSESLLPPSPAPSRLPISSFPLLPEATPFSPPSTPSESLPPAPSRLPIAQQQLSKPMQCPLTLPCWLVMCMTQVQGLKQHCRALGHHMSKKKGIAPAKPLFISAKQNPVNYIHSNLVRMCCGHLHLSTTITMFTSPKSSKLTSENMIAAVLKFFQMSYSPDIEHVVDLFRKQQATLNSKNHFTIEPPDPNFPPALLRPEAQVVALLAHVCRMHASMGQLLTETSKALYQAMLKPKIKFHRLIAMARVFTALLRLQLDPNPLLFFLDDLLKRPLPPTELNVVGSIVGVWPAPLGRKKDVRLLKGQRLCQEGLEDQMLSYTLEVAVMCKYSSEGKAAGIQESFARRLHLLCNWSINHNPQSCIVLTSSLIELLNSSPNASITYCPPGHAPWQFPRPSQVACQVVRCLSLLASCRGWSWTNDVLVAKQLWPVLQQWHGQRKGGGVVEMREVVVVCILRLIGYVSQLGLKQEPLSPSVQQLQGTLIALLQESLTNQIPLAIQLAALDSLLETCPPGSGGEGVARVQEVIGAWVQAQGDQPWGQALARTLTFKINLTTRPP